MYQYYEVADGFQLERGHRNTASAQGFFKKSEGWTRDLMDKMVLVLDRETKPVEDGD